jgi:Fic family protein
MKIEEFTNPSGQLVPASSVELGDYYYFLPFDLPIHLEINDKTILLISETERKLGMLSGMGELLPNPHILINPYLSKEAVLSSKIEGTQASLTDVLRYRAQDEKELNKGSDVKEVSNYVKSLEYGLEKIKKENITLDLIKNMHKILLKDVRGKTKNPGEFRDTQNWIGTEGTNVGESTFVPPPPDALIGPMHNFQDYIKLTNIPLLIQTALMHYHFEVMHPFRDGNGRLGRVLITLFLCKRKALSLPLLYLSAYFENNRIEYYKRLLDVSQQSKYEEWINFFLRGVKEQSEDALKRTRKLVRLREDYLRLLVEKNAIQNATKLIEFLFNNPFISVPKVQKSLKVAYPTAKRAIAVLEKEGIIEEISGKPRNKLYCSNKILNILDI